MRARLQGATGVLVAVLAAAAILVVVELSMGAIDTGPTVANPCKPRTPFPGSGIDAAIQRIVLNGLDGAACRLHTTREGLILSLRSSGGSVHFDKHSTEVARRIIRSAPIDKLVQGGISLSDLLP